MKIGFCSAGQLDLDALIKTEGIGFENEFHVSAKLRQDDAGRDVWETVGGYSYTRVGSIPGGETWEFDGPQNGFLSQDLMPFDFLRSGMDVLHAVMAVKIVHVLGTYGEFEGAQGLEQYDQVKKAWARQCDLAADALGLENKARSDFAAVVWKHRDQFGLVPTS